MTRLLLVCVAGFASLAAQGQATERYPVGTVVVLSDSTPGAIPVADSAKDFDYLQDFLKTGGEVGKQGELLMREAGSFYTVRQGTKAMILDYSIMRDRYKVLLMNGPHYHDSMWTSPNFLKPAESVPHSKNKKQ